MMRKLYKKSTVESWKKVLLLSCFFVIAVFSNLYAQKSYSFSGKVVDDQGVTMPGVSVIIKGTTNGVATDTKGEFRIESTNETVTLVFSFVGSVTQEVKAVAGKAINVTLLSKSIGLSELVVVGYGTQKKSVVTGAISSVKAKDLENMPINRLEQALQGRTSGVIIAAGSGAPGSASTVRVRGITSIHDDDNDPLYVIDGLPIDIGGIDYLNPADIESIEVLKDAASLAIYGTRANSGVILVTTKKGKSGSMQLTYDGYIGTQSPAKKLDLLNATQYAELQNEAAINGGGSAPFPNPSSYGTGTDWQAAIFNNHASIQNHEIGISGGNDRSTYYASIGYLYQEGVVATSISNYERINVRFNSSHKVKDWLRFGNNFGYSHIKSKGALATNTEYGGPLSSAINLDPITPLVETNPDIINNPPYSTNPVVVNSLGQPYGISQNVVQEMTNPLAYIQTRQGNYGWSDNFVGNMFAEFEPIKGVILKSDIGTKLAFWGSESFSPVAYFNSATSTAHNSFYRESNQGLIWNWENTASYSKKIGQHSFTALIGTSSIVENSKGLNATYYNLSVTNFYDASMNYELTSDNKLGGGWEATEHKIASLFGRINYDFNEKYLFTGTIRRDGSSRFGINHKFGVFPAASIGWVASHENFWPKNRVIDYLKIRGSYGVNGNDKIGDKQYVANMTSGGNYTFGNDEYVIGFYPANPGNPDLKWEQTVQSNLGFEATLFGSFNVVFDLFSKKTKDMLMEIVLPAFAGTGNPVGNVATMSNKGVELELGYRKQLGAFNLDIKGNTSYLKNKVLDMGTIDYQTRAVFQSSAYEISRIANDHPFGEFYGFESLGVFSRQSDVLNYTDPKTGKQIQPNAQPGDIKFADLNEDGKIDANDRTFIGNPNPTWSFGLTASLSYKGFDLMIFGQGVQGNKIFNGLRRLDIAKANYTTDALDRWTPTNPFSDYPRLVVGDPNKNFTNPSSFYLIDGSYFRFKTIQIGYTLPRSVANMIFLQKARIYVSGNNLFTITKYTGYDPEIGGTVNYSVDKGVYPQAKSFMLGVNITI